MLINNTDTSTKIKLTLTEKSFRIHKDSSEFKRSFSKRFKNKWNDKRNLKILIKYFDGLLGDVELSISQLNEMLISNKKAAKKIAKKISKEIVVEDGFSISLTPFNVTLNKVLLSALRKQFKKELNKGNLKMTGIDSSTIEISLRGASEDDADELW